MSRTLKQRPDGWWYPYIFVAAFVVIVSVNGALAFFATSTFNGLVTSNAYEKGRLYNQTLAEAERQKALGWQGTVDATVAPQDPPGSGYPVTVLFGVTGPKGDPLDGLSVAAEIRRPAQAGMDQTIALPRRDAGRYGQKVVLPEPGQWEVRVVARRGNDVYQYADRIFVK